jgi:hypothetical protein
MDPRDDTKLEELILRELYTHPGHEAILVPTLFSPPIMLSVIFRLACQLKKKGYINPPDRRMGGWHLRLTQGGVAFCQTSEGVTATHGQRPRI